MNEGGRDTAVKLAPHRRPGTNKHVLAPGLRLSLCWWRIAGYPPMNVLPHSQQWVGNKVRNEYFSSPSVATKLQELTVL